MEYFHKSQFRIIIPIGSIGSIKMSTDQLKKDEIIPDVLDDFKPQQELSVQYNSKSVQLGNEMLVKEVIHPSHLLPHS